MNPGLAFKLFRKRVEAPQEEIAEVLHVSQNEVSKIETGKRPITLEVIDRLMDRFGRAATVLKAQVTFEQRMEFVSVPYLNNVDKHIQTALDCGIEEYGEGKDAAHKLKDMVRNKTSLTAQERLLVMELLDQLVDTCTVNKMIFTAFAEKFDIPIKELEDRHLCKMVEKNYYSEDASSSMAV